jgi:hypothetical protein
MHTISLHKPGNARAMVIAKNAAVADSFLSRLLGLMFRPEFGRIDALALSPCTSIHTFFMRFAIDAVFTDTHHCVVDCTQNIRPWKWVFPRRGARHTIELPAGTVRAHNIKIGDIMTWNNSDETRHNQRRDP